MTTPLKLKPWLEALVKHILEHSDSVKSIVVGIRRRDGSMETGYFQCSILEKILLAGAIQLDVIRETEAIAVETDKEILDAARSCVCGEREKQYGDPRKWFQVIAGLWTDYLQGAADDSELVIWPEDVAAMMALVKVGRIATGNAKEDNWVDLCGYAALGGELEGGANAPAAMSCTEYRPEGLCGSCQNWYKGECALGVPKLLSARCGSYAARDGEVPNRPDPTAAKNCAEAPAKHECIHSEPSCICNTCIHDSHKDDPELSCCYRLHRTHCPVEECRDYAPEHENARARRLKRKEENAMGDHPVIRNLERTGYPEGLCRENIVCPVCGETCESYYLNAENQISGCENCLSRTDAVQFVADSEEDYRYDD